MSGTRRGRERGRQGARGRRSRGPQEGDYTNDDDDNDVEVEDGEDYGGGGSDSDNDDALSVMDADAMRADMGRRSSRDNGGVGGVGGIYGRGGGTVEYAVEFEVRGRQWVLKAVWKQYGRTGEGGH